MWRRSVLRRYIDEKAFQSVSAGQLATLDAFRGLNVLVLGDAMLDCYLEGDAARICPEAPAPVVDIARRREAPGGAANTAANVAVLGARATLLAAAGDDAEGAALRRELAAAGVCTEHLLRVRGRRTLAKHRVLASSQMVVRYDQGDKTELAGRSGPAVVERLRALFPSCDALVVSDYAYGVVTADVLSTLVELRRQHPGTAIVVDARDPPRFRHLRPLAVKPNYAEAVALLGLPSVDGPDARAGQMLAHGDRLLDVTCAGIVAVTLDSDGAVIFERGAPAYRTYARPTPGTRVAGAGDTFVATLALALAAGASTTEAAELASAASAVVVARDGTSWCAASDLREQLYADGKYVVDLERFRRRMDLAREQGKRIVFTNGCFDILHRGHITYLNRAKTLGDLLVVGLNSDAGVRALKGDGRPVNALEDRVEVLAALSCVDHILSFDEPTPVELIRAVRPHVFVKGGDYTVDTLPEAQVVEALGGVVRILPYLEERSTSRVIARIRAADNGAGDDAEKRSAPGTEAGG